MALGEHLTPKQDAFALAYVETGNACEAYRRAYNPRRMSQKAITVESTRLLKHPSIALAIDKDPAGARARHEISVDGLTIMLDDAYQQAIKLGQASAAVSAVMAIAKLHGLVVDKIEITKKRDLVGLSDSELLAIIAKGEAAHGTT